MGGLGLGKLLNGVTAQVNVRKHEGSTSQPTIGEGINLQTSLSQATERVTAPSLSFSWVHGILTSADYTSDRSEQVTSGSLVRTTTSTSNAYIAFAFRPPPRIVKLPTDIRTNARYTVTTSVQCIQPISVQESHSVRGHAAEADPTFHGHGIPPNLQRGIAGGLHRQSAKFQLNQKTAQLTHHRLREPLRQRGAVPMSGRAGRVALVAAAILAACHAKAQGPREFGRGRDAFTYLGGPDEVQDRASPIPRGTTAAAIGSEARS